VSDTAETSSDDYVDHDAVAADSGSGARIAAVVVGVIVVGLIALFAFGSSDGESDESSRLINRRVPEMRAVAVSGEPFDVDNLRGQWVLINFFGTWCPPCVAEHPDLVALETWGQETGRLSLVSVAFNDQPERVQAFFDEFGGDWPVLDDANLSVEFQIAQVPESFLVAPSGLVVDHFTGGIKSEDLITLIEVNDSPLEGGGG